MSDKNNKVKYNLKNAHYALLTIGEDGAVSYAAPVPLPGSVSLSLDANGEPENFYADGIAYYVINNNMGYDGDLELALIPESFRTDVLREKLDAKGVLIENSDAELALFALLFEFYKIYFIWFNALTTASTPARPTLVDFPAPQYWFPSSHVICT